MKLEKLTFKQIEDFIFYLNIDAFSGDCAAFAIAFNNVVCFGKARYFVETNKILYDNDIVYIGHVYLWYKRHFFDCEGEAPDLDMRIRFGIPPDDWLDEDDTFDKETLENIFSGGSELEYYVVKGEVTSYEKPNEDIEDWLLRHTDRDRSRVKYFEKIIEQKLKTYLRAE